jgi:hypothetical protein
MCLALTQRGDLPLAEIDKRFALIDKDDNYFYPFQKAQKETNRYGFALTAVGEQDRHGGGTYTKSIEGWYVE